MQEAYTGFADVYDACMQDVPYDAWAAYLLSFIKEAGARHVVDCACGTGALTLRFFKAGLTVTGVDNSADMLRIAQQKAREQGAMLPFVQQDMRALSLHKRVDAINCACDGVNYLCSLKDVRAFFQSAYRALAPGGLLLFDISSPYKLATVLGGNTFGDALKDCAYVWSNAYDPASRLCEMELTCFLKRGMLYERVDERHVQRAHSVEELFACLEETGFANMRAYEAFGRQAPTSTCERVQLLATRL